MMGSLQAQIDQETPNYTVGALTSVAWHEAYPCVYYRKLYTWVQRWPLWIRHLVPHWPRALG